MEQQSELDEKIHLQMSPESRKSDIHKQFSVGAHIIIVLNKMGGGGDSNSEIVKLFL